MSKYLLGAVALVAVGLLIVSGEWSPGAGRGFWGRVGALHPPHRLFLSSGGVYDPADGGCWKLPPSGTGDPQSPQSLSLLLDKLAKENQEIRLMQAELQAHKEELQVLLHKSEENGRLRAALEREAAALQEARAELQRLRAFLRLLEGFMGRLGWGQHFGGVAAQLDGAFRADGAFAHDRLRFTDFVDAVEEMLEEVARRERGRKDVADGFEEFVLRHYSSPGGKERGWRAPGTAG
uniref:PBX homeobox interacting protein 1 n=1 Tax=Amazona collaria TaxID=241587 RepID=A0A8B9GJD8_9PSIT